MTTEQATETPVLDLVSAMTAASIEASGLDPQTFMLVRFAALVAVDASPASYLMNLEAADAVDLTPQDAQDVLAAIAPIVGTARTVSALSKIVRALGLAIEAAELDEETVSSDN